mgnify:CR=1 FL=1
MSIDNDTHATTTDAEEVVSQLEHDDLHSHEISYKNYVMIALLLAQGGNLCVVGKNLPDCGIDIGTDASGDDKNEIRSAVTPDHRDYSQVMGAADLAAVRQRGEAGLSVSLLLPQGFQRSGEAGAFGAHGLKKTMAADLFEIFEVGVRYQMYHALALILVGALALVGADVALKTQVQILILVGASLLVLVIGAATASPLA